MLSFVLLLQAVPQVVPEVVSVRPHDSTAYTQGLLLDGASLYESTGLYGQSTLREVDPLTGDVLRSTALAADDFGEGLALVDDRLIQITWREHVAYVYDRASFQVLDEFAYEGEGWGLCFDGARLVMSDGTSTLEFRDPTTFQVLGSVDVSRDGVPLPQLNELECVDNRVYANVYRTDTIVRIDPNTGEVDLAIDASGLLTAEEAEQADVLNGIAYDPATSRFLITGKRWPKLFEVEWEPPDDSDTSGDTTDTSTTTSGGTETSDTTTAGDGEDSADTATGDASASSDMTGTTHDADTSVGSTSLDDTSTSGSTTEGDSDTLPDTSASTTEGDSDTLADTSASGSTRGDPATEPTGCSSCRAHALGHGQALWLLPCLGLIRRRKPTTHTRRRRAECHRVPCDA